MHRAGIHTDTDVEKFMKRISYLGQRFLVIAMLSFVALAAVPGTAIANNSEAAKTCQKEGYLDWTDAEGNAFANAGQCVRYVATGGTLKPVAPVTPVAPVGPSITATATLATASQQGPGFAISVTGTNFTPHQKLFLIALYGEPLVQTSAHPIADSTGNFSITFPLKPKCSALPEDHQTYAEILVGEIGRGTFGEPTVIPLPFPCI